MCVGGAQRILDSNVSVYSKTPLLVFMPDNRIKCIHSVEQPLLCVYVSFRRNLVKFIGKHAGRSSSSIVGEEDTQESSRYLSQDSSAVPNNNASFYPQ